MAALHEDLSDIVNSNDQDGDKVKGAIALDAFPGLGKTTAVLSFAKKFHRQRISEEGAFTEEGWDRMPICRVGLTANTGMRDFNRGILEFYAHPGRFRGTAADFGYRALDCVLSSGAELVIIDDLHFLRFRDRNGAEISYHFKYIANEFPVTLLLIGVGLAKRGLFDEGEDFEDAAIAQTGRRTTRLGLEPFTIDTEKGRRDWPDLLLAIEQPVLADKTPGDRGRAVRLPLRSQHRTHWVAHDSGQPRLPESRTHRRRAPGRGAAEHRQERRRFRAGPPGTGSGFHQRPAHQPPPPTAGVSIPRTLPLCFEPLPGETLDSWFEALAHRLHTPLGELLPQLGLPRPEHRRRTQDIPTEWTVMLRPSETEAIAAVCRITPDVIAAMTLAAYDGRAVFSDSDTRHVKRRLLWGRGRGS